MKKLLVISLLNVCITYPIYASEAAKPADAVRATKKSIDICNRDILKLTKADMKRAKKITFDRSKANDNHLIALLQILPEDLEELSSIDNTFTIQGIEAMAQYPLPKSLKVLNFSGTKLGTDGAKSLIFHTPTGLLNLDISNNNIDIISEDDAQNLPSTLTSLNLAKNHLDDITIRNLQKYLERNKNLIVLNLFLNNFTAIGEKILTDLNFKNDGFDKYVREAKAKAKVEVEAKVEDPAASPAPVPPPHAKPKLKVKIPNVTRDYNKLASRVVCETKFRSKYNVKTKG